MENGGHEEPKETKRRNTLPGEVWSIPSLRSLFNQFPDDSKETAHFPWSGLAYLNEDKQSHVLWTFRFRGTDLAPELPAPVNESVHIAFDLLGALGCSVRIHFDGDFLRTQAPQDSTNTAFQKLLPVPHHRSFHHLSENGIAAEDDVPCYDLLSKISAG
jgi:hypothetical protein